jgi:hypothetical protein
MLWRSTPSLRAPVDVKTRFHFLLSVSLLPFAQVLRQVAEEFERLLEETQPVNAGPLAGHRTGRSALLLTAVEQQENGSVTDAVAPACEHVNFGRAT